MTRKITVPYFPSGLKYCTPITAGVGVYLLWADHPIWGLLLFALSIIIFFTEYVTKVDLEKKVFMDYLSVAGIAINTEKNTFQVLDRIVITKGLYSQTINTRVQSRQLNWEDYTATLLMDNDVSLNLLTNNNKIDLLKALKEFTDFLNVGVEDRSTHDHYWIDMKKVDELSR